MKTAHPNRICLKRSTILSLRQAGAFRLLVAVLVLTGILFVGVGCSTRLDVDSRANRKPGHTLVCHKGKKTLSVSKSAVKAHLKHGDQLGSCLYY